MRQYPALSHPGTRWQGLALIWVTCFKGFNPYTAQSRREEDKDRTVLLVTMLGDSLP
jgi:hypothetical protein